MEASTVRHFDQTIKAAGAMSSTNIKVVCRYVLCRFLSKDIFTSCIYSFRPPNARELREGGEIVVSFDNNLQTVQLKSSQLSTGPEKDGFTFDRVFPMVTKQHEVFDYGVKR